MSKELEVLNIYIQQQQQKINEMTQTILMLHTKNAVLEKEIISLRIINNENNIHSKIKPITTDTIKRKSISKQIDAVNQSVENITTTVENKPKESFFKKIIRGI